MSTATTVADQHIFQRIFEHSDPLVQRRRYLYVCRQWNQMVVKNIKSSTKHKRFKVACQLCDTEGMNRFWNDDQQPERCFRYACRYGHLDYVLKLLKKNSDCGFGLDLNYGFINACRGGHQEIMHLLIEKGVNNWSGGLCWAYRGLCSSKDPAHHQDRQEIIDFLLSKGADINYAFLGACRGGNREFYDLMKDICKRDGWFDYICQRYLYRSGICRSKTLDAVFLFEIGRTGGCNGFEYLRNGHLSLDNRDEIGPFISSACCGGHVSLVREVIDKIQINDPYIWNQCLNGACYCGNFELIHLMLSKGATDWAQGLMGACGGGHLSLVKWIIAKKVYAPLGGALETACSRGHHQIVQFLIGLEHGVDDFDIKRCLYTCYRVNREKIFGMLIDVAKNRHIALRPMLNDLLETALREKHENFYPLIKQSILQTDLPST
jgi:hypothetical protein